MTYFTGPISWPFPCYNAKKLNDGIIILCGHLIVSFLCMNISGIYILVVYSDIYVFINLMYAYRWNNNKDFVVFSGFYSKKLEERLPVPPWKRRFAGGWTMRSALYLSKGEAWILLQTKEEFSFHDSQWETTFCKHFHQCFYGSTIPRRIPTAYLHSQAAFWEGDPR